jgi:hypothetical protein
MSRGRKLVLAAMALPVAVFVTIAMLQAQAVERKVGGIRGGMSLGEVLHQLDGWSMINAHPLDGRAISHGTGPEFNGYSGEVFVLTPVQPDGRETDLRKISRAEFSQRLEKLLSTGKRWTVYFSFRTVPTHRGVLVRFNGKGRVELVGAR